MRNRLLFLMAAITLFFGGAAVATAQKPVPGPEFTPSEECPHPAALGPGGALMYCDQAQLMGDGSLNVAIQFVSEGVIYQGCVTVSLDGEAYQPDDLGMVYAYLNPGQYMVYYHLCNDQGEFLIGGQISGFILVDSEGRARFHYNYVPYLTPQIMNGVIVMDVSGMLHRLGLEVDATPVATPSIL